MDSGLVQSGFAIIYSAVLVEAMVNIVKTVKAKETTWQYWTALIGSILLSIGVAVQYDLDLWSLVGLEGRLPFVGAALTGIIISRGANAVSDVLGLVNRAKK